MEFNERSNVNSKHLTNGEIGKIIREHLSKHYRVGEHFSIKGIRRSLNTIPPRKIGGHLSRLSIDKFISQNPTARDDYTILKPIIDASDKNKLISSPVENIDIGRQQALKVDNARPSNHHIEKPVEAFQQQTPPAQPEAPTEMAMEASSEANNAFEEAEQVSLALETHPVAGEAPMPVVKTSMGEIPLPVVVSLGGPVSQTLLAERLLEVAAAISDLHPDLSKATTAELFAELQKRVM